MTARPQAAIFVAGGVLLAAYILAMAVMPKPDGRVVFGDATHHFVQLRSLVYDGDLDFSNEYVRLYGLNDVTEGPWWLHTELTATGHVRNYMPLGPALLWAPLYGVFTLLQIAMGWMGLGPRPDGFTWLQQMAPGVTGVIAATLAAWLAWRTARNQTDDRSALVAVLGAWLGSHAVYYSLVSPSYSHAASMLTASIFFGHWIATRDRPSPARFAIWGALAGLCALMRWQEATFIVIPLIEALRWRVSVVRRAAAAAAAVAAMTVVFSPQMVVWAVLYGEPFTVPQGPTFMQWTQPHLWDVLFSDNHGLFTWAPLLVLSTIGLVSIMRSRQEWRLPMAAVLLIAWYVNAAVADWWAGEAFGARRFLSLFPLLVLGLACWLASNPARWRARVTAVGALFALNWLLLLQYQVFMKGLGHLASYPAGAALWVDRFIVPFRLIGWLLG